MPMLLVAIYVVLGCGTAIFVVVRKIPVAAYEGPAAAVLMVVLWPFLLPTLFSVEPVRAPSSASSADGPMAQRIEAIARSLKGAAVGRPERPLLEAFVERLRRSERSLREMDGAIDAAPDSVRDKLERLRMKSHDKLAHDAGLLEELVAQLTVLRFAEMTELEAGDMDESRIVGLLGQIKALVEISAELGV